MHASTPILPEMTWFLTEITSSTLGDPASFQQILYINTLCTHTHGRTATCPRAATLVT